LTAQKKKSPIQLFSTVYLFAHFSDFDTVHFESLGSQIISNPLLRVVTEDSLCEFVCICIFNNSEYLELFHNRLFSVAPAAPDNCGLPVSQTPFRTRDNFMS
jgi:hypothetical protein